MKKFIINVFFLMLVMVMVAQGQSKINENCPVYINQGVYGKVLWQGGNQMPGTNKKKGKIKPVKRTILIYPNIHREDLVKQGRLFQLPNLKPVAKIESTINGCFQLKLLPGKYSIFTVEKGGLFANMFDSKGFVSVFEVVQGQVTQTNFIINYEAIF